MLCWSRLKLIRKEDLDHELLDFFLFDELRWLIVFQLDDNVITNLGFRRELKQITHQVGNLTLVKESTTFDIDNSDSLSDLLSVKVSLALLLNFILRRGQHFIILFLS